MNMKRVYLTICLMLCFVLANGQRIYSISTGPGEDASSSMGISWATDSTLNNTVVIYARESDRNWDKAVMVEPEQKYFCTAFDGVLSETPNGVVCREKARFNKCGAMLKGLAKNTGYKYVIAEVIDRTIAVKEIINGEVEKSSVHHFKTAGAKEWSCCIISDFHSYTPLPGRLESAMGMIETMKEYDRFEKGSANSNTSTAILQKQLEDKNNWARNNWIGNAPFDPMEFNKDKDIKNYTLSNDFLEIYKKLK